MFEWRDIACFHSSSVSFQTTSEFFFVHFEYKYQRLSVKVLLFFFSFTHVSGAFHTEFSDIQKENNTRKRRSKTVRFLLLAFDTYLPLIISIPNIILNLRPLGHNL